MLEHAIKLAEKGYAVFPLKPHGKTPLTKTGFKEATRDVDQITRWWTEHPQANIGLATGEVSGVFVLDVDVKNDAGGLESFNKLQNEHGSLPETVTSLTWSGGMHLFFKHVNGRKSGAGFRPGIDIRGDGGYIVAPPSEVEGKPYQWELGSSPWDMEPATAPTWLTDLKRQDKPSVNDNSKITQNRDNTLISIAGKLRSFGMTEDGIYAELSRINESRCVPPLPDKDIKRISKSAANYEAGSPNEPLTELWAANEFVKSNSGNIIYCEELRGWHYWDGKRWVLDEVYMVERRVIEYVKSIHQRALSSGDKTFIKFAISLQQRSKIQSILLLSKSHEGMTVKASNMNANPNLVNFANGTYDLESGKLSTHMMTDYITKLITINFNAEARCPRWESFLSEIFSGDTELIDFIQKACGYSLSESTKEQCLFILWGTGANGKSTLLKHLSKIFGEYGMNTPATLLVEKKNESIPNDIARLKDVRFVTCLETKRNKYLDEAQVKSLTGGDIISARFLHREYFDFQPKFKIWFATNHKPQVGGDDKGIWRRLKAIPFNQSFDGRKDIHLDDVLESEYEGILAWVLAGYLKWKTSGLMDPKAVLEHTEEYREDSDVIGLFLDDCFDFVERYETNVTEVLDALNQWRKKTGSRFIGRDEIYSYLKIKGINKYKNRYQGGKWFLVGIKKKFWSENFVNENKNEEPPF